jgi:hypothetical protein
MKKQNLIKRNLGQPEVIEHIKNILADDRLNQHQLAKTLCQEYDFHDARDKPQLGSCSKALKDLERQGFLTLPAPRHQTTGGWNPRRLGKAVAEAKDVPVEVTEIKDLRLVRVEDKKHMRIWNELIIREHPQGHRPLVGRQLRYLIKSEHGWLGALGFASAALQLKDRDRWIGWDQECHREYLDRVVGLSRFLIRNQVHCRNLASRVLSICTRRMPEDFDELYGYRPWLLESFVDRSRYSGTCYRAANWLRIGQTQGRGRQDRNVEYPETVKDIYVYVLNDDFRRQMGLAKDAGLTPLQPATGLDEADWAENEFGSAEIGDKRLSRRLVEVAQIQGKNPAASWLKACRGDRAAAKGYYRMIDNPEEDKITMEKILQPHRERTIRRLSGQQFVLFVSDGSDLDFSNLDQCEGLGVVGRNQTSKISMGLHLHSTLAYTGNGLPLGILHAQCYAPELKTTHKEKDLRQVPAEEKKSFRWIEDLRDCVKVIEDIPNISAVAIMDREADFFALFDEWRNNPRVDLLIRAQHNRCTGEDLKLFDMVSQTPVKFQMKIDISRRSARSKKGKRRAQAGRKARRAEVVVRYTPAKICPPNFGLNKSKEPVQVGFIYLVEENPPQGEDPLEWRLITTCDLDSRETVVQCINWYRLRWRIEDWHRVLKTGCRVEDLSHKTADRLRRAIALKLVIAWRIMLLTLLGREAPHLPATVMFTDIEIEVLKRYAHKKKLNTPLLIGETVILVGRLGGYLGRGQDPPPGHEVLWKGYSDLQTMCLGFELANIRSSPD